MSHDGTEKIAQVVAMCIKLHNVALWRNIPLEPGGEGQGLYAAITPSKVEVQGPAQHQRDMVMWEDVLREFFKEE